MPGGVMIGLIELSYLTTQAGQIEMRCIGGSMRYRIRDGACVGRRGKRGWRVGRRVLPKPGGHVPEQLREIDPALMLREVETALMLREAGTAAALVLPPTTMIRRRIARRAVRACRCAPTRTSDRRRVPTGAVSRRCAPARTGNRCGAPARAVSRCCASTRIADRSRASACIMLQKYVLERRRTLERLISVLR